jgi:predicted transport protein
MQLDDVTEVPLKKYIAYKVSSNFCCVRIQQTNLKLWLNLNPCEINDPYGIIRDVSEIGHFGTGDIEIKVKPGDNLDPVKELIEISYRENS